MMNEFPPDPAGQVTLENWRNGPFNKWAFHHVREVVPSAEVAHDPGVVRVLEPSAALAMPDVTYGGKTYDFGAFCAFTDLDGLVILKDGKLVHESYRNGMTPRDPHICMSVSKSMLGLLCGILAEQGLLEIDAQATTYVPELEGTGFAGATVRDLLDMRCGVDFIEDYLATDGAMIEYRKAGNWNPIEPGDTPSDLRAFFLSLRGSKGPHGGDFDYLSPCTDLLGWVIERATGRRYVDAMSELLWQPLGAEHPAYVTVDRLGAPRTAGGMCMTTRDLARSGWMVADGGWGVVPEGWIEDIWTGGDAGAWDRGSMAEYFPGMAMHYRSKWYCFLDRGPILMCLGIHGQNLFIDREAGLVMAKHASGPAPIDMDNDLASLALFEAIRNA